MAATKAYEPFGSQEDLAHALKMCDPSLGKVTYPGISRVDHELNLNLGAMIDDTYKHFYAEHFAKGFKLCRCSSCRRILRPILIKQDRKDHEYEELHRAYLQMFIAK
jgi:hypothetical protein